MSAVDDFILNLHQNRGSANSTRMVGNIDLFTAALQFLEAGPMSDVDNFILDLHKNRGSANSTPMVGNVDLFTLALQQLQAGSVAAPSIVQHAIGTIGAVINFGVAPTAGNLVVALITHLANVLAVSAGWAEFLHVNGAVNDGISIMYKIVGQGDVVGQQPTATATSGIVALWEIAGGKKIFDVTDNKHDVNATPSIAFALNTTGTNELILGLLATSTNNGNLPVSVDNATQDDTFVSAAPRAGASFHVSAPAAGLFSPGATWAANPTAIAGVAVAIR